MRKIHWLLALAVVMLIASRPWLTIRRVIPDDPGWVDVTHIVVGLALGPLALFYLAWNCAQGRWRRHFPWLRGDFGPLLRDLAGLVRSRIPAADGSGLFPVIKGLTMLTLLAAAVTGWGWWATEGTREVIAWRDAHALVARVFVITLVLHIVAVAAHVLELLRDG
ncbi:MAG: cytochrome b/b6 domain-containing protein [Wenzhouxiangellaceae bacterium]